MRKNLFAAFLVVPGIAMASDGHINYPAILLFLIIIVIIFLLIRELVCWYYKVNERIRNQEEIIRLLKELVEKKKDDSVNN